MTISTKRLALIRSVCFDPTAQNLGVHLKVSVVQELVCEVERLQQELSRAFDVFETDSVNGLRQARRALLEEVERVRQATMREQRNTIERIKEHQAEIVRLGRAMEEYMQFVAEAAEALAPFYGELRWERSRGNLVVNIQRVVRELREAREAIRKVDPWEQRGGIWFCAFCNMAQLPDSNSIHNTTCIWEATQAQRQGL